MPTDSALHCPVCRSANAAHLCRTTDLEYFADDRSYEYAVCNDCGVVFLKDPPLDRLAEIYPDNYYSNDEQAGSGLLARVKDRLDRRFFEKLLALVPGDDLSLLDVGGGTGWVSAALRRSQPRVRHSTVIDINPQMRAGAERNGHEFILGSIDEVRPNRKFDIVLLLNLIEHVHDPRRTLESIRSLLSPTGIVVIKTPNTDTLDRRLFQDNYWGGYHCPRHWVLFNERNFLDLAGKSGFVPRQVSYTQGAPQWAPSVMAVLYRMGLVKLSRQRPMIAHPFFPFLLAAFAAFDMIRKPLSHTAQMFFVLGPGPEDASQPQPPS